MAKILIADDEAVLRALLCDYLTSLHHDVVQASDGTQALKQALTVIPELIVLDVQMPGLNGLEVCRQLRRNSRTRHIPILFLTAKNETLDKIAGLVSGADDYLTKPFHPEEMKVRIESLLRRSQHQLAANPLTRLPGGPVIEEEAVRRIEKGGPLAFNYIDIDNFKAFNDAYGYKKGDEVIKRLAAILVETVESKGSDEDFVGHIGGDDFVLLTQPQEAAALAQVVADQFDAESAAYYNEADRRQGFIVTSDRKGTPQQFPLMTLSIAIVTNDARPIGHYGLLVELAAELKSYAKGVARKRKSVVVTDRRKE